MAGAQGSVFTFYSFVVLVGGVGGFGLYDCCKDVRRSLLNKLNKNGRMHPFDAEAGWDLLSKNLFIAH